MEVHKSVVVVGAAGYIGFRVAKAFRREGNTVYGVVRNEKQSLTLFSNEIIPIVVQDAYYIDQYSKYINEASIIVDATNVMADKDPTALPKALLKVADEASKNRPIHLPKKTFIYTSGIMVYEHNERVRDETWPVDTRTYSKWRADIEAATIQSEHLNTIVIRPGWVFGYDGGQYFGDLMFGTKQPKISIGGDHHDRKYSWIHVDDLSDAYVAAANRASTVHGEIFNIVNGLDNPGWGDLLKKAALISGVKDVQVEWKPKETALDDAADATVILNPAKAAQLLGWTPRIFGFYDNLEFYYQAWKATRRNACE